MIQIYTMKLINLNKELKKLDTWLVVNRLSLNIDETNEAFNYIQISQESNIKYLGIMIDSTLTWHIHIENIHKQGCHIKLDLL